MPTFTIEKTYFIKIKAENVDIAQDIAINNVYASTDDENVEIFDYDVIAPTHSRSLINSIEIIEAQLNAIKRNFFENKY